jgi:putative NADH-flavin reductase
MSGARQVVVFGSSGSLGSRIVRELLARDYHVTCVVRSAERLRGVLGADELAKVGRVVVGDAGEASTVLEALSPPPMAVVEALSNDNRLAVVSQLAILAANHGVARLIAVGGAGILQLPGPGAKLVYTLPGFPDFLVAISQVHQAVFEYLQGTSLDFMMVCPPMMKAGERQGLRPHADVTTGIQQASYEDVAAIFAELVDPAAAAASSFVRHKVGLALP